MVFLYLLLGHFIADYLLQPHSLVTWKNRSFWGVLVHVTIHFIVTGLLLYLYSSNYWAWLIAFAISFLHFFIDLGKAIHQKKEKHALVAYWLDQVLHYLSVILINFFSLNILPLTNSFSQHKPGLFSQTFTSPFVILYLSLAIFSTLSIEYSYFRDRQKFSQNEPPLNHKKMITRLFLVTLVYLGILFAMPLVPF